MTDVVLPLITKRCSMKKEEGVEELMESILLIFWSNLILSRLKSGEHHSIYKSILLIFFGRI